LEQAVNLNGKEEIMILVKFGQMVVLKLKGGLTSDQIVTKLVSGRDNKKPDSRSIG
jgi:hypothetical protein